jgi:hypothetical protein
MIMPRPITSIKSVIKMKINAGFFLAMGEEI